MVNIEELIIDMGDYNLTFEQEEEYSTLYVTFKNNAIGTNRMDFFPTADTGEVIAIADKIDEADNTDEVNELKSELERLLEI